MSQHFPAQQMTIIITPTENVQHEPVRMEGGRMMIYLLNMEAAGHLSRLLPVSEFSQRLSKGTAPKWEIKRVSGRRPGGCVYGT